MHQIVDISIESITKVEGNAGLTVRVKNGRVESVKFSISDYRRFYTEAVKGKNFMAVSAYLARICGTCSMAHQLASIEAIEKALGIYKQISEQTRVLRDLSMNGTMIRDHCLHLFMFSLPDVLGIDSVLDIEDDSPNSRLLHYAFDLKAIGNELSTTFAGAVVHAPFPVVGGFTKYPEQNVIPALIEKLEASRGKIISGIKVFFNWKAELIRNSDYIALVNDDFNFIEGIVKVSSGVEYDESQFARLLTEIVIPYSQAKGYKLKGTNEDYLVGALARINLNGKNLHKRTQESAKEQLQLFPSNNIFRNPLAQAIEVLHCIDRSIDLLKGLKIIKEEPVKAIPKPGVGIGVIEAPRGTLYHKIELNKEGIVVNADVIVPTSQNQINIENDLLLMFQENIGKLNEEELKRKAEEIIRAYDPCMSCSTNFLTLKWIRE